MSITYSAKGEKTDILTLGPFSSIEELEKAMKDFPEYTWKTYTKITFDVESIKEFRNMSQEEAQEILNELAYRRKGIVRPTLPEQ